MIQSFSLLFRRNVAARTRLLAFGSILSMLYFSFMTFTVTALCWFEILPNLYRNDYRKLSNHRYVIVFLFLNAIGNCSLVLGTNTSIKRLKKRVLAPLALRGGTENGVHTDAKADDSATTERNTKNKEVKKRKTDSKSKVPAKDDESKDVNDGKPEQTIDKTRVCMKCKCRCPPRSHHCLICDTCILKRDHHCFFMTVCVGYFNQKYFIMYCFYMLLGTFYGMCMIVIYLKGLFGVTFRGPQTFLYLLYELLFMLWTGKYPGGKYVFLLLMMYGCLTAGLLAAGLWFWQLQIVFSGQTTHEAERGNKRYSAKSRFGNFLDVFGKYWPLTLILPLPLPQYSNGLYLHERRK